ncbi:hypothetical protein F5877DRAFT_72841 [Lentinula edodes]|nr:hypothetical protein F5877DRAFT_72841 [Lentinula edodes]
MNRIIPSQIYFGGREEGNSDRAETRISWKKVGVRGKDVVVLGVEKKSVLQLQRSSNRQKAGHAGQSRLSGFCSTQSGGGPFAIDISTFIVGFDPHDTKPHLPMTEPSGICRQCNWRRSTARSNKWGE